VLLNVHTNVYVDIKIDVIKDIVIFIQQSKDFHHAKRLSSLYELIIKLICKKELLTIDDDVVVVHVSHA
jgi:hypothetical protein